MDWIFANWEYILLGLFVAEKIVKVTPWPYDDIVIDIIGSTLKQAVLKKKDK